MHELHRKNDSSAPISHYSLLFYSKSQGGCRLKKRSSQLRIGRRQVVAVSLAQLSESNPVERGSDYGLLLPQRCIADGGTMGTTRAAALGYPKAKVAEGSKKDRQAAMYMACVILFGTYKYL